MRYSVQTHLKAETILDQAVTYFDEELGLRTESRERWRVHLQNP